MRSYWFAMHAGKDHVAKVAEKLDVEIEGW